jgi:hypothetical protein
LKNSESLGTYSQNIEVTDIRVFNYVGIILEKRSGSNMPKASIKAKGDQAVPNSH